MTTLKKSKGKKSIQKLPAALHIHTSPPSVLGFWVLLFCVDLVHAATTTESVWVQTILAHCKHPLPLVVIYQIHLQLTSCLLLISEPDTIFYVQLFHVYFSWFLPPSHPTTSVSRFWLFSIWISLLPLLLPLVSCHLTFMWSLVSASSMVSYFHVYLSVCFQHNKM